MAKPDFEKTQQDMPTPRLSWYEQRRPAVGDDKSTTITLNWAKVGPMIGLIVFIGGIVTTSVNAAITVASYKARVDASEHKLQEQQTKIDHLEEQVTRLQAVQETLERLQGRMAALEAATPAEAPASAGNPSPSRNTRRPGPSPFMMANNPQ